MVSPACERDKWAGGPVGGSAGTGQSGGGLVRWALVGVTTLLTLMEQRPCTDGGQDPQEGAARGCSATAWVSVLPSVSSGGQGAPTGVANISGGPPCGTGANGPAVPCWGSGPAAVTGGGRGGRSSAELSLWKQ